MTRTLVAALFALTSACQLEDVILYRDVGASRALVDAGARDAGGGGRRLTSAAEVLALLEGKTLLMDAAHVPSHPNGYDEDLNFGSATQCIHRVQMDIGGGAFTVVTELARLEGAPSAGDRGSCDRSVAAGGEVVFNTTAVLVENVQPQASCFDITLTYAGFGQEGRGAISDDQRTVSLELFFRDQAVGHRCADGAVGAASVTLNQEPFTGSAVQVYAITD